MPQTTSRPGPGTAFAASSSVKPLCVTATAVNPGDVTASRFAQVCVVLLQSQQHYCVQDDVTFSRLLCVSRELQRALLSAAGGCLRAKVPVHCDCVSTQHPQCMIQWLLHHLALRNIKVLEVEASDLNPDAHEALVHHLQQLLLHPVLSQQRQQQRRQQQQQTMPGPFNPSRLTAGSADRGRRLMMLPTPAAAAVTLPSGCHSVAGRNTSEPDMLTRYRAPVIFVSWHVCGLPPSSLSHIPGAQLTSLTLRDSRASIATAQALAVLMTLKQLHLSNLNPGLVSLASALAALTALTELFIRDPSQQEQQAFPASLQRLTVGQRTPPWGAEPALEPLRIPHLTALTSLAVQEWFARGVTQHYALPCSLRQLSVGCITAAAPLLSLRQLQSVRLSSIRHSEPEQLLQLSSLPALTAIHIGTNEPPALRLSHAHLRTYAQFFAALPVQIHALTIQPSPAAPAEGLCTAGLAGLAALTSLQSLRLEGGVRYQELAGQLILVDHSREAVTPLQLSAALSALTALTHVQLNGLWLADADVANTQRLAAYSHGPEECTTARSSSHTAPGAKQTSTAVSLDAEAAGHWFPVLTSLAQLPSLRKLICRQINLGTAATGLIAASSLEELELHDCGIPDALVGDILQHLAGGRSAKAAGSTAGSNGPGGGSGNRRSSFGGCLTSLKFSRS